MKTKMKTSINGINLIKSQEGFRAKPYLDVVGVPTIGYGTTIYPNGKVVTLKDKLVTPSEAVELIKDDLIDRENKVCAYVQPQLNQNQFDAIVDFCYNEGTGGFKQSHLLLKINANPNDPSIKDEFMKWDYAGHKVVEDLKKRRELEVELYFSHIK